ncbi:MAG: RNA polymerase sporulation sigma factor SigG [Clostridia bacterium]|nr:RNA polymerase sporulation sigma factor SigG [Clostridia bacterium]
MKNKVEICGVNTADLKVLKNEENVRLLERFRAGDLAARDELVKGNLRLVLSVVQRFTGRGELMDDLFQVGCIGLIKSIQNFDLSFDVRLSTYCVPMIIGEIRRYLRDNSSIRVSRSLRDVAYRALKMRETLQAETQKEPTVDEIAKRLSLPREDVVFALDAISEPVSLYEPVYSDGTDTVCVMDQVSDQENNDEKWSDRLALKEALAVLNEREKKILRLRFFEGRTQSEVASEIGISQAQVSRLEKGAILRMKKQMTGDA